MAEILIFDMFASSVINEYSKRPQLNRLEKPEGGALTPCNNSRAHKEESFFSLAKTATEKLSTICLV